MCMRTRLTRQPGAHAQNLLGPVRERLGRSVVRAGVHFEEQGSRLSIDALLGRKVHVQLIETIDHLPVLLWPHRDHLR